ncbi:hypothetical protein EFL85_01745 [Pediococcus pentosaceus]|nr:hypothetical protein [Pediococcus pentosaceus]
MAVGKKCEPVSEILVKKIVKQRNKAKKYNHLPARTTKDEWLFQKSVKPISSSTIAVKLLLK